MEKIKQLRREQYLILDELNEYGKIISYLDDEWDELEDDIKNLLEEEQKEKGYINEDCKNKYI